MAAAFEFEGAREKGMEGCSLIDDVRVDISFFDGWKEIRKSYFERVQLGLKSHAWPC